MQDNTAYDQLLLALRARLRLDEGLGISHVSGVESGKNLEQLLAAIAAGSPSRPAASKTVATAAVGPASAERSSIAQPKKRRIEPSLAVQEASVAAGSTQSGKFTRVPLAEARPCPEREAALAPWREKAMTCQACELCKKRTTVVWGEGSLESPVMFVGEGPGREEDEQGRPFVGRSGRLLTDIIEKGMKVLRGDVYITNVVKCRPPGNREPRSDEIAACSEFLNRQIETIAPKVIVAVGGVAGCALLGLPPKTGGLRGRWHEYRGIPLRVIFHPSYLLRQRSGQNDRTKADRDTWADIQLVMARL